MNALFDFVLILVLLTNLALLGTGRLSACIREAAFQGMVLGTMPLLVTSDWQLHLMVVAVISFTLKGILFPKLLLRSLSAANVRHETRPVVGYSASLLVGVVILVGSFWSSSRLDAPRLLASGLAVPVALSTMLSGLFLIVSRRQALMQVVGYLVLENGIYVFGVAMAYEEPLLVEMGILLDVFVAVFVMGIAVFHISREFDHIDVDQLSQLRD